MKWSLFPSKQEALIASAILGFVAGVAVCALATAKGPDLSGYIASLATLIAAFSGSWFAFYLTDLSNKRKEKDAKILYINKSLFVLLRQINAVEGFVRDMQLYSSDEHLAFQMPAYKSNEYSDLKQNFDELAFLASTSYAQDLLDLTVEQERFEQILMVLRIRHEHYVSKVMPEMMAAGLTDRKSSLAEIETSLNSETYKGAIQGAKQMRTELSAYMKSSVAMHQRLNEVARKLFPHQGFLRVDV